MVYMINILIELDLLFNNNIEYTWAKFIERWQNKNRLLVLYNIT